MVERKKKKAAYIKPRLTEVTIGLQDGIMDGITLSPSYDASDDDKVKGEVIWASEEEGDSFNPHRTDIWDTEW